MNLETSTQFFMIRALPEPNAQECLITFYESIDFNCGEIKIVDEKETREETLNHILKARDKDRNLFIFVDDIRFKPGWWQALSNASEDGDIVGFSMIDPQTGLLQDFGYDFVTIDNQLTYRGLHKHCSPNSVNFPKSRECSSVCGCAMWIRKDVFHHVSEFPLDGQNRWGEMLFSVQAKRNGFKTVVVSSHLDHYGTSTKNKADAKLSSLSWLIERDLWNQAATLYLNEVEISESIIRKLSDRLLEMITSSDRVVIYGCGTVADFICNNLFNKDFYVVAGLTEEIGEIFLGNQIQDVNKFKYEKNDLVIVTPIGYKDKIEPFFLDCKAHVVWMDLKIYPGVILYDAFH
mgnify:CR=1 FL=1